MAWKITQGWIGRGPVYAETERALAHSIQGSISDWDLQEIGGALLFHGLRLLHQKGTMIVVIHAFTQMNLLNAARFCQVTARAEDPLAWWHANMYQTQKSLNRGVALVGRDKAAFGELLRDPSHGLNHTKITLPGWVPFRWVMPDNKPD